MKIIIKGLDELKQKLDPKKVSRATVNALNQTGTEYRKQSVNESAKVYNIQKKRLKKDASGKPTTFIERAKRGRERVKIGYRPKRPGLHHFSPNKSMVNKKKSPKVKIKKSGTAEIVERGFFQTAKGARGLFQRTGKNRFPMVRRTGPSMKQMYEDDQVSGKLEKKISGIFNWKFRKTFKGQFK